MRFFFFKSLIRQSGRDCIVGVMPGSQKEYHVTWLGCTERELFGTMSTNITLLRYVHDFTPCKTQILILKLFRTKIIFSES